MLYSNCPHCLRTVKLKPDNTFAYHIRATWDDEACPGFKQPAKWAEERPLLASARDPRGKCMRCQTPIADGPKEGCDQCGPENWVRIKENYKPIVFDSDPQ